MHLEGETSSPPSGKIAAGRTDCAVAGMSISEIAVGHKMVHLEGETSNALFDELAEWNERKRPTHATGV